MTGKQGRSFAARSLLRQAAHEELEGIVRDFFRRRSSRIYLFPVRKENKERMAAEQSLRGGSGGWHRFYVLLRN